MLEFFSAYDVNGGFEPATKQTQVHLSLNHQISTAPCIGIG